MVSPQDFCDLLARLGLDFYCGVPDSLLKPLCAYVDDAMGAEKHVITANEGNAVGLATGHFLGSGDPAVVYMQNSGLGNAVNPLVSLADKQVYGIPMMLIIGWRGEPGIKDEPQHVKQGQITPQLLTLMDIPYVIVDQHSDTENLVEALVKDMRKNSRPVAVLVRKNTFSSYRVEQKATLEGMSREQALEIVLSLLSEQDLIISTTGKTSRELFELRVSAKQSNTDFLTVGAMGHTASIAMGVALTNPQKRVVALDGDGSVLMHMGALPVIAQHGCANFIHFVFNNGCHESVGGQPTVAKDIDLQTVAKASGYAAAYTFESEGQLRQEWESIKGALGPILIEVQIRPGSRDDLGRPTCSPVENKLRFMQHAGKNTW